MITMNLRLSTICYLEKDNKYLMLYRNKEENDINDGKWLGVGGGLENEETPEECIVREVREETGLKLNGYKFRGTVSFFLDGNLAEYIFVYTSDNFIGKITECDEGDLHWIDKDKILDLNLWEGDKYFLKILLEDGPLFSMKVIYHGDDLVDYKIYYI